MTQDKLGTHLNNDEVTQASEEKQGLTQDKLGTHLCKDEVSQAYEDKQGLAQDNLVHSPLQ